MAYAIVDYGNAPKVLREGEIVLQGLARALQTRVIEIAASVLKNWAEDFLATLKTTAASTGIPTDKPLSPVTQAIKGHGKYMYHDQPAKPAKFWDSFDVKLERGLDSAVVRVVPKGVAAHVSRRGRSISIGDLMVALNHRGFLFSDPEHVRKIRAYLFARTGGRVKDVNKALRRVGRPRDRTAVIVVPPRPIIPDALWQAAVEDLKKRLMQALGQVGSLK